MITKTKIPLTWPQVKLGKLFDITSSKRVFQDEWKAEGVPFYRAREIVKLAEDGFVNNELFIDPKMYGRYKNKYGVPQKDDLLITGVGTIGILYRVRDSAEFYFKDGNIIWLKNKNIASSKFIEQFFKSHALRKQILGANPITTVATYTIDAAKNTTVNLPPLPEQHRIVVVLETWDKAIELLTKKITLKKQVKKGLMQKLLTGEVRLPGFRGEWKKTELGELLNYEQPIKYLVSSTNYSNEYAVPVLTAGKTFILGYTDEKNGIYNKLPVIIFDDFTTANKYVTFPFKAKSSAMKLLTPKNEKVNLKFVFERIQIIDFPVGEHKRQYLSEYQFIPIKTPSIEEQNAIALFSEKADKELSLLNQKLSEIQKQKKFLLNNLITGAIRTPENMDTYSK